MSTRTRVLLAMLLASACGPEGPRKLRLSIATGGTGGVFYPYGGGIAKVITQYVPNVEATGRVARARERPSARPETQTMASGAIGKR